MCQRAPTLRALWATRSTVAAQHSSRTTSSIRSSDRGRGGGGEESGRCNCELHRVGRNIQSD